MLPTAHILAPMVLLRLYDRKKGRATSTRMLLAAGLFGALPDILNPHFSLAGRASWSHSLLILVPLLLLVLLTSDTVQRYLTLLFAGFSSHLALDIISAPYNFLYPLDFSHGVDLFPEFGPSWFYSWYAVDLFFLTAFVLLMTTYRD